MVTRTDVARPPHQLWMLYMLECPLHTGAASAGHKRSTITSLSPGSVQSHAAVNWTATYRADSTIVTPYEKWVYHQPGVRAVPQNTNYAANKTKQVAWFVSNCGARSDHGADGYNIYSPSPLGCCRSNFRRGWRINDPGNVLKCY